LKFLERFPENLENLNYMKFRVVGDKFFHPDKEMDRQTDREAGRQT
jgi:hypothetical protein